MFYSKKKFHLWVESLFCSFIFGKSSGGESFYIRFPRIMTRSERCYIIVHVIILHHLSIKRALPLRVAP